MSVCVGPDLSFRIAFRGPFHIALGQVSPGLDRTVDRHVPLPASSLKGVMRAEACWRVGLPDPLVAEVFGSPGNPSPWAWSDGELAEGQRVGRATRIRVVPGGGGAVHKHMLMFGEHWWASTADFTISLMDFVAKDRLSVHRLVLEASARSVTALGGGRRRGEGWVSIRPRPAERTWSLEDSRALLTLRQEES